MSLLKVNSIIHPSGSTNNITLDTNGNLSVGNTFYPTIYNLTLQNTTSGANVDFTGIPSWAKRITVMFRGVSTNGGNNTLIQLGTSSGVDATGYISTFAVINAGVATQTSSTTGFMTASMTAARTATGIATISLIDTNIWVYSSVMKSDTNVIGYGAGEKALTGTLDRIRITTTGSVDTFDAGSMNISYEG